MPDDQDDIVGCRVGVDLEGAAAFWEQQYCKRTPSVAIRPHSALVDLIAGRRPGRGLELGCGHGDNAIWCATQGWDITAVDISATALERVMTRADDAGVGERIHTERHDLMQTLPSGPFDLVFAMFMHSPPRMGFVRERVLRHAADTVSSGGFLLDVAHGSRLPWSWPDPSDAPFPLPAKRSAPWLLTRQRGGRTAWIPSGARSRGPAGRRPWRPTRWCACVGAKHLTAAGCRRSFAAGGSGSALAPFSSAERSGRPYRELARAPASGAAARSRR